MGPRSSERGSPQPDSSLGGGSPSGRWRPPHEAFHGKPDECIQASNDPPKHPPSSEPNKGVKTTSKQNKRAASHHTRTGGWDEGSSRVYGASTVRETAELQAAEINPRGGTRGQIRWFWKKFAKSRKRAKASKAARGRAFARTAAGTNGRTNPTVKNNQGGTLVGGAWNTIGW